MDRVTIDKLIDEITDIPSGTHIEDDENKMKAARILWDYLETGRPFEDFVTDMIILRAFHVSAEDVMNAFLANQKTI